MAKDKDNLDNPEIFYRDEDLPAYWQALADAEKDPDKKAEYTANVARAKRAAAMTETVDTGE